MSLDSTLQDITEDAPLVAGSVIRGSEEYTIESPLKDRGHVFSGRDADDITLPTILTGKDKYLFDRCLPDAVSPNHIYLATDSKGKKVLVKRYVIQPRESFERSKHIQRIIQEGGGHPHLIMSSDFVQVQKSSCEMDYFEIVPFIDGVTIAELYKRGNISREPERVSKRALLSFIPQICDALSYMHSLGIVHRDIKPGNFYLASKEKLTLDDLYPDEKHFVPYLFDYNIGYHPNSSIPEDRRFVSGTMPYVAPEIWRNREPDLRNDIFAMGISIYKLVTGVCPFDDSPGRVMFDDIPNPKDFNPNLSDELSMVIMKALEKDPEDRYQSIETLKEELRLAVI